MVDLHTHVMYGWDDGAESVDESLGMAEMAAADGIRVMAATPHLRWRDVLVDPDMVRERVAELNGLIAEAGIDLHLVTGTEIPASWDNVGPLKEGRMLKLGDSHTALIEMPFRQVPVRMNELIFQLRMAGITPLIAHPERSQPFLAEPGLFERTIAEDVPVQITAASLTGSLGETILDLAWRILEQERPIVVASDAHGTEYRRPLLSEARATVAGVYDEETADLFFRRNPEAVLADGPMRIASLPRRAEPARHTFASRLKRAFRRG